MISIIVPVYNVEKYLERCIKSILGQTYTDYELILVDDGSEDSSGSICDEYSKIDNRISVIHQKNGGLSAARNAGLGVARGEYITFIDSDDYVHKEYCKILLTALENNQAEMSIGNHIRFEDGDYIKDIDYDNDIIQGTVLTNIEALEGIYSDKSVEFSIACNKLYKKSLFDDIKFLEGRIHEDEFIAHRLLYKCKNVAITDAVIYYYYTNQSGIMNKKYSLKHLDGLDALEDRVRFFEEHNITKLYKNAVSMYLSGIIKQYNLVLTQLGDKKCARRLKKKFKSTLKIGKERYNFNLYVDQEFFMFAYPFSAKFALHLISLKNRLFSNKKGSNT